MASWSVVLCDALRMDVRVYRGCGGQNLLGGIEIQMGCWTSVSVTGEAGGMAVSNSIAHCALKVPDGISKSRCEIADRVDGGGVDDRWAMSSSLTRDFFFGWYD